MKNKLAKPEAVALSEISDLAQNFIDLCSPSPKHKTRNTPIKLMSLKMPDFATVHANPDSDSDHIDEEFVVVTPVRRKFKIEDSDSDSIEGPDGGQLIIDLRTPDQTSSTSVKHEIKGENPHAPHIIDICTPEHKSTMANKKPHPPIRPPVEAAPGIVRLGAVFHSWEEARDAVYTREERLGHRWRIGQSKANNRGDKKKVTIRCNHYRQHIPVHSVEIDPADHRKGKSIKTSCEARVNINRIQDTSLWKVTLTDWDHNHPPEIPEGGSIRRPVTKEQKAMISKLATATTQQFSRGQIAEVVKTQTGASHLEPRQIGNVMNQAREEAKKEVERLGGDMNAI
ncbi:hypothetical protein GALMADRAFT_74152, partial [Galerina marginata CBS 339.88]